MEAIIPAFLPSLFKISHSINVIITANPNIIADGKRVSENLSCPILYEYRNNTGNNPNKNGCITGAFFNISNFPSFALDIVFSWNF
jgi:hypothetical protein